MATVYTGGHPDLPEQGDCVLTVGNGLLGIQVKGKEAQIPLHLVNSADLKEEQRSKTTLTDLFMWGPFNPFKKKTEILLVKYRDTSLGMDFDVMFEEEGTNLGKFRAKVIAEIASAKRRQMQT